MLCNAEEIVIIIFPLYHTAPLRLNAEKTVTSECPLGMFCNADETATFECRLGMFCNADVTVTFECR